MIEEVFIMISKIQIVVTILLFLLISGSLVLAESVEEWYKQGLWVIRPEEYEEAIMCYDKALDINPKYANAWYNKGLALYKQKKYEKAIMCYAKDLDFNHYDADAWYIWGACFLLPEKI